MNKKDKILSAITQFSQKRYMKILMDGFMAVAAISIASSLFNLLKALPIGPWQEFLTTSGIGDILSIPISIGTEFMAIYITLSMANKLAKSFGKDGFAAALIALGSFMILTPLTASSVSVDPATGEKIVSTVTGAVSLSNLGSQGIFLGIIVGLLSARIYVFLMDKNIKLKMPASIPPAVSGMFENMIPGGIVFLIFLCIQGAIGMTDFGTAQRMIYSLLQGPLMGIGATWQGLAILLMVTKLVWMFGVHGGAVTSSVLMPLSTTAAAANLSAFAAGTTPPFPEFAYGQIICSNAGLVALTLCLFFAKSKQYRVLSKIALPTSLFNISEPIMFGMPLMFNFYLGIPFIVAPLINLLLTKFVLSVGVIAPITGAAGNFFLPIPISMALINGHWSGFVWGVVLILINMALFWPFFKLSDRQVLKEEQKREEELTTQNN